MAFNRERTSGTTGRGADSRHLIELIAALIMACATVLTAWCSYESANWTRRSTRLMTEVNSLERQAGLLRMQGLQGATIHSAMFMQLLAAKEAGNDKLAQFYADRFPPDVRQAYDAWIAQKPFENPQADAHPFVPKLYEVRGTREADDANRQAAEKLQTARAAGTTSGQYLANTVLFATVLFFINAASKFEYRYVRLLSFAFAITLFLTGLARTAILPR